MVERGFLRFHSGSGRSFGHHRSKVDSRSLLIANTDLRVDLLPIGKMSTRDSEYLTAAQLARKLDQPGPKILRRIHSGDIHPDGMLAGRYFLFRSDRLSELQSFFAPKVQVAA